MMALYGRHYDARYRAVANAIENGASVLDVCCGPAVIYRRYLRAKRVAYVGLDINPSFVRRVIESGALAEVRDVRDSIPLPEADYVLMQASLYHFLPDARPVLQRMRDASRHAIIIAEPIRNLATSRLPLVSSVSRLLTDAGAGSEPLRFSEAGLDRMIAEAFGRIDDSFLIEGGREKVYVHYLE
jgi:SAM-dependent methyltransferase